ncbi:hypothetical protein [Domibacillus tundrae]|uniref:hypothetical protein n=1 Tax=Domibacillus tundrae TaxID=1587527 RepID=UPI0006181FCC|nr:hypothetical protein [Domibacillus tundrae]
MKRRSNTVNEKTTAALRKPSRTINSRLRALRTFFAYCISKGITASHPVQNIVNLKVRHEVGATFSRQQLQRLLDTPKTDTFSGLRDLAVMTTFAHTGIRLKEVFSIRTFYSLVSIMRRLGGARFSIN